MLRLHHALPLGYRYRGYRPCSRRHRMSECHLLECQNVISYHRMSSLTRPTGGRLRVWGLYVLRPRPSTNRFCRCLHHTLSLSAPPFGPSRSHERALAFCSSHARALAFGSSHAFTCVRQVRSMYVHAYMYLCMCVCVCVFICAYRYVYVYREREREREREEGEQQVSHAAMPWCQ